MDGCSARLTTRRRGLPRALRAWGADGEPVIEIHTGDVVYIAPGEKHWHGAGPETFMVHMAVNPATNSSGGADWMEPVTDEEYAGGAG